MDVKITAKGNKITGAKRNLITLILLYNHMK